MIDVIFDKFVTSLETDNVDLLNDILDDNVELDSSALGIVKGKENVIKAFKWQGEELTYRKTRILNMVNRKHGNQRMLSCYSFLIFGKEENDFLNIFQCGFLNVLRITDDKIVSIKANMCFECGNTSLVTKWWKMIDYSVFFGCKDRMVIDGHKDNPFECVPEVDPRSDEEEILEAMGHYSWCADMDRLDDAGSLFTQDMEFDYNAPGMNGTGIENFVVNPVVARRFRYITYNGKEYPREVCWSHVCANKKLEINGDEAYGEWYRIEPNRIGTRFFHKYNLDTVFYTLIYFFNFKKINGKWYITKLKCDQHGPWQYDEPNEKRYF